MEDLLGKLDDEQREAVTTTEGYVRVVAGAGTGKTRALAHRFAYLVDVLGVLPSRILCATFSSKSANEMRQRIRSLAGDAAAGHVNTFHGFCVSVLQEDSHAVQYPRNFLVLDNSDVDAMLKVVYEERGLSLRDMTYAQARDRIEIRKTQDERDYFRDMVAMTADGLRRKYEAASDPFDAIFYGYLYQEKKCFGLDYNDLIVYTLHIFDAFPDIRLKWQKRLEYIMVDEFQDIDPLQHRLMEALSAYHGNLFVVGDPDQTIYTWRGASVRSLLDFDRKFSPCHTVVMTRNYRSTPQILAVANSLIARNAERFEKDLRPVLPDGARPLCLHGRDPAAEAAWIAERISALHAAGVPFADVAVLYRAHYVTRAIEGALRSAEIPYAIYSGTQFFDRAEIKDALSYLRLVAYRDDLSFLRVANVPKRNIGLRRMAFLKNFSEQNHCSLYEALERSAEADIFKGTKAHELLAFVRSFAATYPSRPVSETLRDILDESGYERMLRTEGGQARLDNLAELRQSVYEYETACGEECTLEHYLSHVALFSNRDAEDVRDRVKLMTVHAAKGLEFPYVFLAALNEGVLPSRKTASRAGMEEERRLAFVAMTRAGRGLFLSSAGGRALDGPPRYPSRFLLDVDGDCLDFVVPLRDELVREVRACVAKGDEARERPKPAVAFAPGDRVRHPVLGPGVVLGADAGKAAYEIRFDRIPTPRVVSFRVALARE